jgi:hypothetical protein
MSRPAQACVCSFLHYFAQGKRRGSLLGGGTNPGLEDDRAGGNNHLILLIDRESTLLLPLHTTTIVRC